MGKAFECFWSKVRVFRRENMADHSAWTQDGKSVPRRLAVEVVQFRGFVIEKPSHAPSQNDWHSLNYGWPVIFAQYILTQYFLFDV